MTNVDIVLKSRDITLLTNVHIVKAVVFFSSHIQMWELDSKKGWVPKNWCLQTVVLKKTLESPLDSKEIQPVNPKRNQPWIFIGYWSWSSSTLATWCKKLTHWKRPWFWEILRGGEEEGQQRMIWSVTDSMDMSSSKLREIVNNMEAWRTAVHEVAKGWTWLSNWTGEGNGTPLQYSCLANPMDGGAW